MGQPILVGWRNGVEVARVEASPNGPPTLPNGPAVVAFDSLELHAANNGPKILFQVVCNSGQPAPDNSLTLAAQTIGGVPTVVITLSAVVRCFIGGKVSSDLVLSGVMNPATITVRGKTASWLQFTQLTFGSSSYPNRSFPNAVNFDDLLALKTSLTCELSSPLLQALGLRIKCGGQVSVGFVPAPVAAPNSDPVAKPSDASSGCCPYALRFSRKVALEAVDQTLAVGPVTIDLPRSLVTYFRLDGCGSTLAPLTLWQTGPVLPNPADAKKKKASAGGTGAASWVVTIGGSSTGFDGLPPRATLAAWNHAASLFVESLQTVSDGRPNTLLPLFALPGYPRDECDSPCPPSAPNAPTWADYTPWIVTLNVTDAPPSQCPDQSSPPPVAGFRAALPWPSNNSNDCGDEFNVNFPGIICQNPAAPGLPLTYRFDLVSPVDLGGANGSVTQSQIESVWTGFVFRAKGLYPKPPTPPSQPPPPQRVRIGSLDLELASIDPQAPCSQYTTDGWDLVIDDRQSQFQLWFQPSRYLPHRSCLPVTDNRLFLLIQQLYPGGEDALPPDMLPTLPAGDLADKFTREDPVIVPLQLTQPSEQYTLEGLETSRGQNSQTVSLQIYERQPSTSPTTSLSSKTQVLVVVDREPLLLARVHAPAFVGLAGADGNLEVGNWLSDRPDGSSWQLTGATGGFALVFPPQGIGEGTEKGKNLGVSDTAPVGFRFSPAAQFQILGSFYQQNFTEASWNLRRILGYPGQQSPGAIIQSLAFELLYGLNCQVRTPGLQLAELAARIGDTPGPLPDALIRPFGTNVDSLDMLDDVYQAYQAAWADQYAAYQCRLGIFEPWNLASTMSSAQLTVSDRVVYALRTPQLLAPDPAAPQSILPGGPLLSGGVLWGLEFEAQYQELLANPTATGALSRPAFSALGGWGYQKAVFANGLTTIYSDTAMGRTFYYSVEQRGRIAGFWNYAKHVVVYERTVAPSAQFAGTASSGANQSEQDHLPGRPVLRKVREYVELIQPIRTYPDFNAKPVASGCVQAIEFKTRIIPVDGTWGRDVNSYSGSGDYATTPQGYALPLWQKGADPSIYPKPHVGIRVAGASASGATFPLEIAEPEKLLFYADTIATSADTDTWPAVRDVDFPDLAFPASSPINVQPGTDLDATVPSEVPVHSGYEAYTYAVIGQQPVNMVATRTAQAVGAMVHNVTMVRSSPASPTDPTAISTATGLGSLGAARNQLTQIVSNLPNQAADAITAQLSSAFNNAITSATQGAQALQTNLKPNLLNVTNRWSSLVTGTVERWQTATTSFLNGLTSGTNGQPNLIDQLTQVQNATDSSIDKVALAKSILSDRLDVFHLAVPNLDPGTQQLQDVLGRITAMPDQATAAVQSAASGAMAQFSQLLQGITSLSADLQTNLNQAADDAQQELTGVVNQAIGQARNAASGLFQDLPGIVGQAGQAANDQITSVIGSIRDAIQNQDLSTLLGLIQQGGSLSGLEGQVASALSSVTTQAGGLVSSLANQASSLLGIKPNITGFATLGDLVTNLDQRLLGPITTASSIVNDVSNSLTNELKNVAGLTGLINDTSATSALQGFATTLGTVGGLLQNIDPSSISDQLSGWQSQLSGLLSQSLPADALRQQVGDLISKGQGALDDLTNQLAGPLAAQFPDGLSQAAGNTLWLARAFGDAPNVAGLAFNRAQLGYFYNPVQSLLNSSLPIDISPVNALLNRTGDELKSLGTRLPATQLLDQILPAPDDLLKNFNLGDLLPDFAGLKLDKLLPSLLAPSGLADKVKITHQFDQQKASGWVQADVNIPEDGPTTLFDAGPISVSLDTILLTATMRITAGLGGSPQHTQSGQLSANWTVTIGGQDVITFNNTALTFNNSGQTHFSLDPKNIEFNGVLAMLSQAMQAISSPGGSDNGDDGDDGDDTDGPPQPGLTFKLLEQGGSPVGVVVSLEIPLPDITFGVCGLTNLSFGATFELDAVPEFALALRAHVAQKTAPFTITIFILGGGGWFDVSARYLPLSNRITTSLSIGVSAGATLAIDFGVVKGSIYAYFYIEAELQTDSAAPGIQLTISIGLVLGGQVDVLCIVSVALQLLLELSYSTSDHSLTGRGTISLSIKICWLISISVHASVEKRFATIGGGSSTPAARAHALAAHAMSMTPGPLPAAAADNPICQGVTSYLNTLE